MENRLQEIIKRLYAGVKERDIKMTVDGRISEKDAAVLLDMSPATLKAMRLNYGVAPKHSNRCIGRNRISYYIEDVANWLLTAIKED